MKDDKDIDYAAERELMLRTIHAQQALLKAYRMGAVCGNIEESVFEVLDQARAKGWIK